MYRFADQDHVLHEGPDAAPWPRVPDTIRALSVPQFEVASNWGPLIPRPHLVDMIIIAAYKGYTHDGRYTAMF